MGWEWSVHWIGWGWKLDKWAQSLACPFVCWGVQHRLHCSYSTEESCTGWYWRFILWHGKSHAQNDGRGTHLSLVTSAAVFSRYEWQVAQSSG